MTQEIAKGYASGVRENRGWRGSPVDFRNEKSGTRPLFPWLPGALLALVEANMAQRTGLEPATPGVTGRYSNRLNYRCA